jgi:fatty acid amide hydrolase
MISGILPAGGALTTGSAVALARQIANRAVTAVDAVEAHIARVEHVNRSLNAVVIPLFDEARAAAKAADESIAMGRPLGPLHGVPITIKECFHLAGTVSSIGVDRFREEVIPTDGPLVRRLRAAGAILLGKTNIPQAMLLHETANPVYGATSNPWALDRSSGGSSGGEAAIIAAGGSMLGLANDLGGSIRQPAHVCGICGIKPTAGRLTNRGCRNNLSGLKVISTQPGVIARHVDDLAVSLRVLSAPLGDEAEYDDETSEPLGDPSAVTIDRLRVGMFEDDGFFRPSPAIRRAVRLAGDALSAAGVEVVPFRLPDLTDAITVYFGLIGADGGHAIGDALRDGRVDFRIARLAKIGAIGPLSRRTLGILAAFAGQPRARQLLLATGKKSAHELDALRARLEQFRQEFGAAMDAAGVDALICPPHGLVAPPHGSTAYLPPAASYCFLANLLGFPAGSVPATRVQAEEESDRRVGLDVVERAARTVERGSVGLPVGVQVAARHWREDIVLAVMKTIEDRLSKNGDYPRTPFFVNEATAVSAR